MIMNLVLVMMIAVVMTMVFVLMTKEQNVDDKNHRLGGFLRQITLVLQSRLVVHLHIINMISSTIIIINISITLPSLYLSSRKTCCQSRPTPPLLHDLGGSMKRTQTHIITVTMMRFTQTQRIPSLPSITWPPLTVYTSCKCTSDVNYNGNGDNCDDLELE